MAPTLRCPDCGHRHPLSAVAELMTFRCASCGRSLKVPEQYRRSAPAPEREEPAPEYVGGGRVEVRPLPPVSPGSALLPPLTERKVPVEAELSPLRLPWRLGIWLLAVPLGAVAGAFVASALGLLSMTQLEDVFLQTGTRRFGALLRLVPAWAIATALIVHGTIGGIDRWRRRRLRRPSAISPEPPGGTAPAPHEPADAAAGSIAARETADVPTAAMPPVAPRPDDGQSPSRIRAS
jgi:DNA-directed RNA polymerase subunit RPC12/RpoP